MESEASQAGRVKVAGLPIRGREARRALSASGTLAGHALDPPGSRPPGSSGRR